MKKVTSICFAIALILSLFPEQIAVADSNPVDGISLVASSQSGVELIGQISSDNLQTRVTEEDGQMFTEVSLEGWGTSNKPGEPSLPFSTAMIGVPFGVDLSLEIIPGPSKLIYLDAPVLPGTTQILQQNLNLEQALNPLQSDFDFVVKPDIHIYASNSTYPNALAEIVSDGVVRDQRIASIALYPIQYDPNSRTLQVFESIFIRVTFSDNNVQKESGEGTFVNPFDMLLSDSLLNYENAKNWRLPAGQAVLHDQDFQDNLMTAESVNTWQPPTPSWRILTEGSGLFSLDYDDLAAAGVLSGDPNPKNFSLYRQGVELAIDVMGEEDDIFDLQDEILFYAPEFQSKYTRFDAFWLTISDTPGLRITPRTDTPPEGDVVTAYNQEYRHENNLYYRSILKGTDDFERFVGEYIVATGGNSSQINLPFETNSLALGSAELTLRVFGWNYSDTLNPDHHLKVYLNENFVGEAYWDGSNWLELTLDVSSYLNEGGNTLILELPNDLGLGTEVIYLDWFTLNYSRATRAINNQLEFNYQLAGDWVFNLEDFNTNDRMYLRIWDVSDTGNPVEISDFEIITEGSNDYTLAFGDEILTEKRYLAIDLREANQVSSVEADNASDLLHPDFLPQMIIISHAEFLTEAERLADYRRLVGVEALAVNVQDIYDEFAYGVVNPQAIKDYLSFALDSWNTEYVLLLGDGHYDPKDYLGFGRTNYIPAFLAYTDPWWGETAADNRYVTLIGDDLMPDMMLGRLTVNTLLEATRIVNKIISYEDASLYREWVNGILSVADDPDGGGNFPQIAENLFADLKPDNYDLDAVHYMVTHTDPIAARSAIVEHMNNGKVLVNYIGHGSYNVWADEPLFSRDQVGLLTNTESLSINLSMTCTDGFFHDPSYDFAQYEGLAETVTRSTDAGAIASWSPTGLGIVTGHDYLDRGFLQAYFNLEATTTLGDAVWAGKLNLWQTGSNQDLLDTYTLFGDPALRILHLFGAISDSYTVVEDEALIVPVDEGVLANDINPDGRSLIVEMLSSTSYGDLSLNADGSFIYVPSPDYSGIDSFDYRLFDGSSYSNSATVNITVTGVNDPPVALDQWVWTLKNTQLDIELQALDDGSGPYFFLGAFNENGGVSGDELSYSIVTQPSHGELSGTPPYMTYTPDLDYLGADWFTFQVNDGQYDSNVARVDIQISVQNIYLPLIFR